MVVVYPREVVDAPGGGRVAEADVTLPYAPGRTLPVGIRAEASGSPTAEVLVSVTTPAR